MMFGQDDVMTIEHEILKENYETLLKDYESLQKRIEHEEETFEVIKKHFQSRTKELEVANARLLKDCESQRNEKERYKKLVQEMKTMESKVVSKSTIDELKNKNQELLLEKKKEEEDLEKMQNKYVGLVEKLDAVEVECAYLKSLYENEVAASVTGTPVMSGIGETENLIGKGRNEVNNNVKNNVTDAILIRDESDAEHDNPPKESNITSHQSLERNQGEQCRNRAKSSSSSSSSSSSDGYNVVVKLPPNWPNWAARKGSEDASNKS